MSDRINKLREKQPQMMPMARAIAEDALATAATKPSKAPKPPVLHAPCGHTTKKGLPEELCGPCRSKAEHEAAVKRRAEEAKKPALPKAKKLDKAMADKGRLPDKSTFILAYNAEKQEWSGVLNVPGMASFDATKSGVFGLLQKLDWMYRLSLCPQPQTMKPINITDGAASEDHVAKMRGEES